MNRTPRSDSDILKGCLRQDRMCAQMLYDKYSQTLFKVCLRYAKDRSQAQDWLQDAFVQIFRDLWQVRDVGRLGAWMRKVTVRTALQHLRKQLIYPQTIDGFEKRFHYNGEVAILADLSAREILSILQTLPQGYRTVFNLYVIEGYSHMEIADMLNISVGTSKSQLFKARQMMREILLRRFKREKTRV